MVHPAFCTLLTADIYLNDDDLQYAQTSVSPPHAAVASPAPLNSVASGIQAASSATAISPITPHTTNTPATACATDTPATAALEPETNAAVTSKSSNVGSSQEAMSTRVPNHGTKTRGRGVVRGLQWPLGLRLEVLQLG